MPHRIFSGVRASARRRAVLHAGVLLAAALAGGCASDNTPFGAVPHGPETFRHGYHDGCYSALADRPNSPTWGRKNDNLFRTDADYRKGWKEGNEYCATRATLRPRSIAQH